MAASAPTWTQQTRVAGELVFRLGRDGAAIVAEWPGCLLVRVEGKNVRFEEAAGAPPARIAKLKNGAVRAMLRQLEGRTSLHGSAVVTPQGALAFIGKSGAGKSTFAASWVTGKFQSEDCAPLADDVVHLEAEGTLHSVLPSEEPHFLDAAASHALGLNTLGMAPVTEKLQHVVGKKAGASRLRALIVLDWGAAAFVRRIRGTEAHGALLAHVARFVVDDHAILRAELLRINTLLGAIPLYSLERPPDFEQLGLTQTLLLKHLETQIAADDPE